MIWFLGLHYHWLDKGRRQRQDMDGREWVITRWVWTKSDVPSKGQCQNWVWGPPMMWLQPTIMVDVGSLAVRCHRHVIKSNRSRVEREYDKGKSRYGRCRPNNRNGKGNRDAHTGRNKNDRTTCDSDCHCKFLFFIKPLSKAIALYIGIDIDIDSNFKHICIPVTIEFFVIIY